MIESNEVNRLVLVDGSSFLFRAFHAVPPLSNDQGQPTNAIYGVTNMLKRLLADEKTPYVAVVFDAPGKTFRHQLYREYKANRPPMPNELKVQIAPLFEVIRAMGLPLIIESDVEADDVIGTLTYLAQAQGFQVVISTGDKDMAQLVNDQVSLVNTMTNKVMDIQGVQDKFGVLPEQIIDYLALMGDTVDNIPGVPKVGPKTAAKWLNEFQTLEQVMASAESIKGKVGENLRASLDQLLLSKTLTTIKCDLQLSYVMDDLKQQPLDTGLLKQLVTALGFVSWSKKLAEQPVLKQELSEPLNDAVDYETIYTEQRFDYWLNQLQAATLFSFDTETTSLNYLQAEVVGVSFAIDSAQAAYLPVAHNDPDAPQQLSRDIVLARLKPLLEDSEKKKIGQNLKYDAHVLANYGIHLQGIAHDTMLQSYVLNSTVTRHDMDSLAKYYLGRETIHYEDVAGKGAKQISFQDVAIKQAAPYAAEDADVTLQLHQKLWAALKPLDAMRLLYETVERPLIKVLMRIERNGVLLDYSMLNQQSMALANQISGLELQAHEEAGKVFNLSSPKQIQEILYDQLQLPVLKKTPKGQPSTAESVLQELAIDFALPKIILDYRQLSKLKSTYTDKLPQLVQVKTGRVHTSYHQAVTATGRLSSTEPNLQNIPVRSDQGRKIRQSFIAPDGFCLVAADYSQIELRIMAHLSADEGLLAAFSVGEDIHKATAAEVFGVDPSQVSSDLRRSAKAINFGLIYGMSAFGLAQQLGVSRGEAQSYIELYFSRYPGVKNYMDTIRELAAQQGYVETLFGRRLYLPEINSRNGTRRQYAERTAINAPMQGSAADIIKKAMINVDQWIMEEQPAVKMIMQVHDELVFEVPEISREENMKSIKLLMSTAAHLAIPLIVDMGYGQNWDEAH
ncbi:MAG: DNA polymerase I [Methylococcales bacterium]|jgi:DNA polymerase-1|nr:DNA polymerase I [Methylococcales bacterium]MBT3815403.1 DNA polymerase I [Methylococcales bacterium]MBT4032004.1 DNA polymerase I [Methylococcales bacterium]MBT4349027.1 DNA polymerase I [Methylococcales bacterium]MBT4765452.1 DNA polymerase I [Methylococcales bacterium]